MANGDKVKCWDGTDGIVEYRTSDGWYGVRQGSRIDEWQWWQSAHVVVSPSST